MHMGMELRHEMVPDTATRNIFKRTQRLLDQSTDHQKALQFVASKKDMARYRDMIDFLFCEIFIEHRRGCFLYYSNKGPQLVNILSEEAIERYDHWLVGALNLAHERMSQARMETWTRFRVAVLKIAA